MKKIDNSIHYEQFEDKLTLFIKDKYFAPYGVFEILKLSYEKTSDFIEIKEKLSDIFTNMKNTSHASWVPQKITISNKKIIF